MHHVRQRKLPFVVSSHDFLAAEQGDTGVPLSQEPRFGTGSAPAS